MCRLSFAKGSRRFRWGVVALCVAAMAGFAPQVSARPLFEPSSEWMTLGTEHFRIYYLPGFESRAKDVANIAEEAHRLLVPYMQVTPQGLTEVVIADGYDELNSLAHSSPHRAVWLWQTPPNPDEGMAIGRYDQWLKLLFVHEYTHILQGEHTPWLVNQLNTAAGGLLISVFPQLPIDITLNLPDLLTNAPSYFTEGLAVHTESLFTPGGRGKEGDFEMLRRMAFLEGQVPSYDQIYGRYLLDWPMGGYEYTWGSIFVDHLTARFGEDAPGRILKTFGQYPWLGFDSAVSRTVGVTAQDVWRETVEMLRVRYQQQQQRYKARERERAVRFATTRDVSVSGRYHRHPVWDAKGVLYYPEALKNEGPRLYADALNGEARQLIKGQSTRSAISFSPDGQQIYYEADTSESARGLNSYRDLFVYDRNTKKNRRLTQQARTFAPQVSPDGREIVAVTSGGGKTGLAIYDVQGKLLRQWRYDNDHYQFGNPVWSPDGRTLAVAVWHAGSRDLWLVDAASGQMTPLWQDEAVDLYPSWSPDGKHLVFCSDRQGTMNLYTYECASGKLRQLTDVLGGAFDPAVSPDGKQIAFSNYSGRGYDIQTISFHPERAPWVTTFKRPNLPGPFVSRIPATQIETPQKYWALPTFVPSLWFPVVGEDEWGTNLTVYSFWQDVLRQHFLTLLGGYGFYSQRINYGFRYDNFTTSLPFSLGINEFPSPGRYPLQRNPQKPDDITWADIWQWNKSLTVSFSYPGIRNPMFEPPPITGPNWTWGYRQELVNDYAMQVASGTPGETRQEQLNAVPLRSRFATVGDDGTAHSVFLQWQQADTAKRPYDNGPTAGSITTVGGEAGVMTRGDRYRNLDEPRAPIDILGQQPWGRFWADHRMYWPGPAIPKSTLALRSTAGLVYNRNGDFFFTAWRMPFGYTPLSTINRWDLTTATEYSQRTVLLRGYSWAIGNRQLTTGLEYRLPLGEVARGWGEVPVFVNRLYAVGFVDTGLVWGLNPLGIDLPVWDDFKLGVGAELRAQTTMFQAVPIDVRIGVAQGLTTGGSFMYNGGLGTTF